MHDVRELLALGSAAVISLARRGYQLDLQHLSDLQQRRNRLVRHADELRAEAKGLAHRVRDAQPTDPDIEELHEAARALKDRIRRADEEHDGAARELTDLLLGIPNLPADEAPDGDSEHFAVELRKVGEPKAPADGFKDHVALGESMGILDFRRATKLSGPRFSVLRGAGAALERALIGLFLELHTHRHGYVEYSLPILVTPETMTGTGQLPKFEQDLFRTGVGDRDLFLIPTAEVPLTNLHAGEVLPAAELPIALTAATPCFRSEAGSYGRDTRGLIRQHQFHKVEMVRICTPESSGSQAESMLQHAETCMQELDLKYRVVKLAAGDLGFAARLTYDIEVWMPGQQAYREISSVSDFGQFQGRRAGIRTRDSRGRAIPAATVNGSGLPIGRTIAALLEQHQQPDGSVSIPAPLARHLGFRGISAAGALVQPQHR